MKLLENKIAIITGATRGIGRGIAVEFAKQGANIAFTYSSSVDAAIALETELNALGIKAKGYQSNAAEFDTAQELAKEILKEFGSIDVLVNNAGMMQEARVEDMSLADWERNLTVNLTAPFLMIKAALPHLRATKGSIVNTGSIEGLGSNSHHASYCASKAGLHGLTRAVAIDHGHEGIRCNAVAPGWVDTELNEDFIESMDNPKAFRANIGKIHPVARTGRPAEVAALVAFLAAEESGFITGQIYTVDGGRMAKLSLP